MLKQQEPHSALVLDRYWNVIRTNEAAPRFFGSFVDLEARKKPRIARPDVRSRGDAAVRGTVGQSLRAFFSAFTAKQWAMSWIKRRWSC